MTRVDAPIAHAYRHGGTKEKGRVGGAPEKASDTAHGGRCTCITPGYRTVGRSFRKQRSGGSNPPRGVDPIQWALECLNTPEPATEARLRGYGCTVEGSLSIPCRRASRKGARREYLVPRETNSSPFHARGRCVDPLS